MYKSLFSRPRIPSHILIVTLGVGLSVPVCYYVLKRSLTDTNNRIIDTQQGIVTANGRAVATQDKKIPAKASIIAEQKRTTAARAVSVLPQQKAPTTGKDMASTNTTNEISPPTRTSQPSTAYTATFSVPLHCESCTSALTSALSPLPGLQTTTFSIPDNLVTTTGTAPPSSIISAIQSTGRTAILRGSGAPNTAAVCILETPPSPADRHASPVRGLARLIELDEKLTMLDLTLSGLLPGVYRASVRETGDVSRGVESVGGVWRGFGGDRTGELGVLEVGRDGRAGFVGEMGWRVWELVGRGLVVERVGKGGGEGEEGRDRVVLGVVARSAGVWENEKVVCGCSGKTVWEEREEMVERGMV